jgi:hypothetical protein
LISIIGLVFKGKEVFMKTEVVWGMPLMLQ